MKLTNEEIANVFAMYLGSGYKHRLANEYGVIDLIDLKHAYEYGYIILTPLSKISDEDAIEVAELYGLNMKKGDEIGGWNRVDAIGEVRYKILKGDCLNELQYSCYQYLISQSYAVPLFFSPGHLANSKTAIELGIAIEKIEMI